MSEIDEVNPKSTELPVVENLNPISLAEEIRAEVESEVEIEGKVMEGVDEEISLEDYNKKNYVKITPTLYIQPVESKEVDDKGEKLELYKILNPETEVVETRELTGEEKREIRVQQLKESKIRFKPIKLGVKTIVTETITLLGRKRKEKTPVLLTNVTVNQFGADYRKKRQRKNKMAKASRRANRK